VIRPVHHWSPQRAAATVTVVAALGALAASWLAERFELVGIPNTSVAVGVHCRNLTLTAMDGKSGADTAAMANRVLKNSHVEIKEETPNWQLPMVLVQRDFFIAKIPLWMLIVIAAAPLPLLMLERRSNTPGTCRCGYNLTGNVSGMCPECGQPVEAHTRAIASGEAA